MGEGRQRMALVAILAIGALAGAVAVGSRHPHVADPPASSPPSVHFAVIGDYGANNSHEAAVADLVDANTPDFVATVGDNTYGSTPIDTAIGQYYADYIGSYQGTHGPGSPDNRFFPALGNHDISDGGGLAAYQAYFDLPGSGVRSLRSLHLERVYDFVRGPVHFFVLDSDPSEPLGITAASQQAHWLQAGLAASPSPWNVVLLHHAPFSSSTGHGSTAALQWPYEQWGADLVLAGHDHTYERIVRDDDNDGTPLTYVVDGLGGQSPYGFSANPVNGSQVRYAADYGALFVDATETSLTATFRTVANTTPDSFTLTAPAAAHIVGTVTHGGDPVVGAFVHAIDYRADPSVLRGDETDAAGHYDITVPAPDRYALGVLDPTGNLAFEYHDDRVAIDPADDVAVTPGATATVDVDLAPRVATPGSLSGTVTDGSSPLAGVWAMAVTATGVAGPGATTDAAGHYTISGLAPGSYKLIFTDPTGARQWEWFDSAYDWMTALPIAVTSGATTTADAALIPTL